MRETSGNAAHQLSRKSYTYGLLIEDGGFSEHGRGRRTGNLTRLAARTRTYKLNYEMKFKHSVVLRKQRTTAVLLTITGSTTLVAVVPTTTLLAVVAPA